MWKKRLIQALWITTGIAAVVLLGAAMNQKSHKVCTNVKIEITGAEQHMFIDEKDVLNILNNGGEIRGRDIANIELRSMEEMLEKNPWVRNAEMFFDNQQVLMVTIEERQPIARVFTISGKSFYLDTAAMHLPLSEKISARVPVFTGFTSDKKVSGAVTGNWSYNSSTKILDINGVKCNVSDAWDWEAPVRNITITYSGFTSTGSPVWGKKVQ